MPMVGILEAVLLRLCEMLALTGGAKSWEGAKVIVHSDIMNLILSYQSRKPGLMHCSIPFLSGDGDRFHVSLSPVGGLPALPHRAPVTSVCRLLGAEGLTALLAAVLTECKILVHSADVANLAWLLNDYSIDGPVHVAIPMYPRPSAAYDNFHGSSFIIFYWSLISGLVKNTLFHPSVPFFH